MCLFLNIICILPMLLIQVKVDHLKSCIISANKRRKLLSKALMSCSSINYLRVGSVNKIFDFHFISVIL